MRSLDVHNTVRQVADFGLSTFIESRSITNTLQVTNPRSAWCTCTACSTSVCRWLAPELLRGERASAASDVYAFGTTVSTLEQSPTRVAGLCMWELLTLQVPFAGLHFGQITLQVPRDGLRPPLPAGPSEVPGGPSLPGLDAYITLLLRCCTWLQCTCLARTP